MPERDEPPKKLYPQVSVRISAEHFERLWRAAATQHYRNTKGAVEPGALLRVLISLAWPLFEGCGFSPERVEKAVGGGGRRDSLKEWLWEWYKHLPDDRADILRGLADRYNYGPPPISEHDHQDVARGLQAADKTGGPTPAKRRVRGNLGGAQ